METRILIAEANTALVEALRERMTGEGFIVQTVSTGTDALRLLDAPIYDAVLLDRALPDTDGIAVLREMRTRTLDTPVMLLSTRTSVAERVLGLDSGADDYLIKPFHMDECMARVRRLVRTYRRKNGSDGACGAMHCIADLTVDTAHHVATRGGKRLSLSAKECAILEYLALHPDRAMSLSEISAQVSGGHTDTGAAIVPVYIHYLRRKVDAGFPLKLLHTVRGGGYMLSAAASPRRPDAMQYRFAMEG